MRIQHQILVRYSPVTSDRDAAGDSGEPLSEDFWSVARRLRSTSREVLAPWDITPSHLRALRVLGDEGAMRPSALAERLRIAPRSVTEVVDALEARGLAERRPDPGDRRASLIEMTGHAAGVLDAIRAARGAETERFFARLSETERADLARILRKLMD
jgi:DNA-binding MarR family transcriptional regulator